MPTSTINSQLQLVRPLNIRAIKDEILHRLRLNIPDPKNRGTVVNESFTGDGTTRVFELTQDKDSHGRHTVKYYRNVIVNNVGQKIYKDYVIGLRRSDKLNGKVAFATAPTNGHIVTIEYVKGNSFIFTESPRIDRSPNNYPQVTIQVHVASGDDADVRGGVMKYSLVLDINCVSLTEDECENIIFKIHDYLTRRNVRTSFHNIDILTNPRITPCIPYGDDQNEHVFVQTLTFDMPNNFVFTGHNE